MRYSAEVVVIGAGVVGCSIALELARAGRDILVLDKAGGIGHGSTSASSGIVRFHYSTLTAVAAAWEAVHGWRDWAGHLGVADPAGMVAFRRTGILVLEAAPGDAERTTALFDRVGVPWQAWGPDDIAGRLRHVDPGRFGPPARVDSAAFFAPAKGRVTATFTPDAGHVEDPQLAAHNLGVAARHHGARFLLRQAVTAVEVAGPRRWSTRTGRGDIIDADVVVNAAGPWSAKVNAMAGVGHDFTVSCRPLRQEVHQVDAPPGFANGSGVAIADPDLGVYLRSTSAGGLLVGGMEPECDPLEWLDDPDDADPRPSAATFEAQVLRAARRLPDLAVPHRPRGLAGVYDASSDWAPIYDRTAAPGFFVAIGTSGNQFKNAPVIGLMMGTLITAVEAGHDHDRQPVQVPLPRTGGTVDMAAYSRLRPVPVDAPASVMG